MKTMLRYYRANNLWVTPTGRTVTDYEQELLNEIEMLRLELDELNHKLSSLLNRVDL